MAAKNNKTATPQKPVIGLLGGPCSGKSAAAHILAGLGCAVISADELAHEQLEENQTRQALRKAFGDKFFDNAGRLDKRKLSEIVFANRANVEKINSIIHPPVLEKTQRLIERYKIDEQVRAIVLDVPLLVETGWEKNCDILIFIDSDEDKRLQRAAKKGDYFVKQLKKRENYQISLDKKADIAQYIIRNNSGLSALAEQVTKVFTDIIG